MEGYRSARGLQADEIDRESNLLQARQTVLDLGAAPAAGSKLPCKRSSQRAGSSLLMCSNGPHLRGYHLREETFRTLSIENPVDVVLSRTCRRICRESQRRSRRGYSNSRLAAIELCAKVLKRDGVFVVKLFHGEAFEELRERLNAVFRTVKVRKTIRLPG
jgi:23S rRNA (uridine2552-2'-O)-methyltransferase